MNNETKPKSRPGRKSTILIHLNQHGPATIKELVEALKRPETSVRQCVWELEKRGRIRRMNQEYEPIKFAIAEDEVS